MSDCTGKIAIQVASTVVVLAIGSSASEASITMGTASPRRAPSVTS